jgi:hypothetical protein
MTKKNKELENIFLKVKNLKKSYYKKLLKTKKINNFMDFSVLICSGISTTNIIITIGLVNPITLIISGVFSGITTILKVLKNGLRLQEQQDKLHITYCQLSDLERDLIHNIENNKNDHDFIISVNNRLSLIEDSAIVISLNSK